MQIKQYFKGIAKAAIEPVYKALSGTMPNYAAGLNMSLGGVFTWNLAGTTAYNNKIFYAGLNILVKKLVEAPILFNKKKAGNTKKFDKFYSKSITNEARFVLKELALTELEDHPLNKLFDDPNTYQSGIEMMEDFWYNYGFGDGFLWFETPGTGRNANVPVRVNSLNRRRVDIVESTDENDRVGYYRYTTWRGTQIRIEKENMLHMRHWNPNLGDLKGYGVDIAASMDISLNNANNTAQGAAFINGGRGVLFSSDISVDKDGAVTEKMTAPQMEELQDTIKSDYAGAMNNRRMHFTNGFVKADNYGDTLAEMEMVATEDSQWKNIFTIIGVPWVLSPAASTVSENSIIVGFKSLVTNTAVPELRKFDQKLRQKVKLWFPDVIPCHDLTEFSELAPDLKLMSEVYGKPTLSEDERRAIFSYDEMPDGLGKNYLVASGLMKIQDIISDELEPEIGAEDL